MCLNVKTFLPKLLAARTWLVLSPNIELGSAAGNKEAKLYTLFTSPPDGNECPTSHSGLLSPADMVSDAHSIRGLTI
jgi:hypothetical protein